MGSYTMFGLDVRLSADTPAPVIQILQLMLGDGEQQALWQPPGDALFACKHWRIVLSAGASCFQGSPFVEGYPGEIADCPALRREPDHWRLHVLSSLTNYDAEIERFPRVVPVDWG
jgi:hypothetical protein